MPIVYHIHAFPVNLYTKAIKRTAEQTATAPRRGQKERYTVNNKLSTDDGWERITRREAERLNDEVRKA